MSELNDNSELQRYSSAFLHTLSAFIPPTDDIEIFLNHFAEAVKSSTVSSKIYPRTRSILYLFSVMEDPPSFVTRFGCFLPPESVVSFTGRYFESDGHFTRLLVS